MPSQNLGFANPFTSMQADAIGNQFSKQLTQNILPQIGSQAQLAGGFGGSRQGIAEGNAIGDSMQGLGNSLAGLYSQNYNTDTNAFLTNQGQNQNFYTAQRGLDLQQQGLGANLFNQGMTGNLGIGSGTYGLGQQFQNAPVNAAQQFGSTISPFSGLGSTQTSNQQQNANPWSGALGGAILGSQVGGGKNWGQTFSSSNNFGNVPYNNQTTIPMQPGGGY